MSAREESLETTDLPPELVAQLVLPGRKRTQKKRPSKYRPVIIRLLGENGPLTVNRLLVDLHRATNKVMTRGAMYQHLRKLQHQNLVKRELTGVYALSEKGKQAFTTATGGKPQ